MFPRATENGVKVLGFLSRISAWIRKGFDLWSKNVVACKATILHLDEESRRTQFNKEIVELVCVSVGNKLCQ